MKEWPLTIGNGKECLSSSLSRYVQRVLGGGDGHVGRQAPCRSSKVRTKQAAWPSGDDSRRDVQFCGVLGLSETAS